MERAVSWNLFPCIRPDRRCDTPLLMGGGDRKRLCPAMAGPPCLYTLFDSKMWQKSTGFDCGAGVSPASSRHIMKQAGHLHHKVSHPGGPDSSAIGVPQAQDGSRTTPKNLVRLRRPDSQAIGATHTAKGVFARSATPFAAIRACRPDSRFAGWPRRTKRRPAPPGRPW